MGLTPHLASSDAPEALARELLARHRGQVVVLAWHHGPHEPLARALGVGGPLPEWTSATYDRIWIICVGPSGTVTFEERRQDPVPEPVGNPG